MTNPTVNVRALAQLARLELSEQEIDRLEKEIPGILGFVEQIQSVMADLPKAVSPAHRNIVRDDAAVHPSGEYTEDLLSAAPAREGNRVAVKQVLKR